MCPSEAGEIQGVVVVEGGGERKGMVGMVNKEREKEKEKMEKYLHRRLKFKNI